MGVESCFCCFINMDPGCLSLTGTASNIIILGFMLWGILDLDFVKNVAKAFYITSFVLFCLCLIFYLIIFIIIIRRRKGAKRTNSFGKILCLLIPGLSLLASIFLIIGFILELVEHVKMEDDIPGKFYSTREWASLIVPLILGYIGFIIMLLCANALYRKFGDWKKSELIDVNISQKSMSTIPNALKPGVFPNNNGVVHNTQESGTIIKN